MISLVKKEWLLANIRPQREDVSLALLKLNMDIKEAQMGGHTHYVWEAYKIKENPDDPDDQILENIDQAALLTVIDEIKKAGYGIKVFEPGASAGLVRVDISWDEKPPLEPHHQEKQYEDNMLLLRRYDRWLEMYRQKLDLAISNNYSYKIAYLNEKIEETTNLKAVLLQSMERA